MITIDSALHHLYNKVKDDKNSTADQIESINAMVQYVNNTKKEQLNNNKLFSKLYIIYFGILTEHFKDLEFTQKEIQKDLSEPISYHLEFLRLKINNLDTINFLKSIELDATPHYLKSKEELKIEEEKLINNVDNLLKHSQRFSKESVTKSLNIQISEVINKFQHYD